MIPDQFVPRFYKKGVRVKEVAFVFFKHGFFWVAEALELTRYFPRSLREQVVSADEYQLPMPVRIRRVIEELGPTYVKAGQVISSRPDLIPQDVLKELSKLQDDVPAFPFEQVQEILENELQRPLDQVYLSFSRVPVASASIGQVHEAVLRDGREVVVKVQRPDIEQMIQIDTDIMFDIARYAEKRFEWARMYNMLERIEEFNRIIRQETDYTIEGQNADRIRRNFTGDDTVYIPEVYWDWTTRRVLTMEYIHGIKLKDKELLLLRGYDLSFLTESIANAFIKMVLIDGFFHGDPHFGNIIIMEGQVVGLIDFGMVGVVDPIMKRNMAKYFISLIQQDAVGLVEVLDEIAEIDRETDRTALVREVGRLIQRYSDITLGQIRLEDIVIELFNIGMKYKIKLPGEFTLMDKTLVTLEGLGRHLNPDFDLVSTAEPAARMLFRRELDPANFSREMVKTMIDMRDLFTALPKRLDRISRNLEEGHLKVRIEMENYIDSAKDSVESVGRSVNRLSMAIVVGALLIASSSIVHEYQGIEVFGVSVADIILIILLMLSGGWIFGLLKSSGNGKKNNGKK